MLKIKHERDCDCVVAGFRWHKKGDRTLVGSLLLGLFDNAGALQHVGVCASFSNAKRLELAEFLRPYREDALVDHPGRLGLRLTLLWLMALSACLGAKAMESRQGPIVGTVAPRTGG